MRTLARFLSLLLCVELIVSPIAPNMSFLAQNAHAEDCPTGFSYDSILNRCLTKTETANVMNVTMACGEDKDCYKKNAIDAISDKIDAGEVKQNNQKGDWVNTVGTAAAVAVPLTIAVIGQASATSTCSSTSFWAMVGGSAALFVGDNLANMQHNKRLNDIHDEWGKTVNPEQANGDKDKEQQASIEAQSKAFEMLAKAEQSLSKAAGMKKTFFMIAGLAYLTSAALSAYEIIQDGMTMGTGKALTSCPIMSSVEPQNKKESLYAYYSNGNTKEFFLEEKFYYNLQQSRDLASFIVNKNAFESNSYQSPSIDQYVETKSLVINDLENDKTLFNQFKEFTIIAMKNISPISEAHANEAPQATTNDEAAGNNSASSTSPASSDKGKPDSNAAKTYREVKGSDGFLKSLIAAGVVSAAAIAVAKIAFKGQALTPEGRLAWALVLAGWTGIMYSHAAKQEKESKKRAELLLKMQAEFASASGAIYTCKSEDRNDPGKPNCYCYTSDNQRNSSRGNSQICQKLWAGINAKAGSYTAAAQGNRVCVNQNRQADATCACRSTNTCMKVSLKGVNGLGLGTMSVLGNGLVPLNKISDGSIDSANINEAALANQAAKMSDLVKKLESNPALKKNQAKTDKLKKDIAAKLTTASAGLSSKPLMGSSNSSMPSNPGEAARMLDKEIADQAPITAVSGSQTIATGSEASPEQPLEFGLTGDQLAAQEGQIAEAMKQDLDYGGNDINQGSKTNIFDVLSNRYQRSGMRRLFDEKGETKPEAAAKTDITQ